MIHKAATILVRLVATSIVIAPVLIATGILGPRGIWDREGAVDWLAEALSDLRRGRITEAVVLVGCIVAMAGTWMRMVWAIVIVASSRLRGRDPAHPNRLATRIALRMLMITPVVVNATTTSVEARAVGAEILDIGTRSESRPLPSGVLLVSIAVAVGVGVRLRHRRLTRIRTPIPEDEESDSMASRFESEVARQGHGVALARVDLAVRSLLAAGLGDFRWLIQHPSGTLHVEYLVPTEARSPWTSASERILSLGSDVALSDLGRICEGTLDRVPIVVPVGSTSAGTVWINLEVVGSFSVSGDGPGIDAVWRGLCESVSLSPLNGPLNLVGSEDAGLHGCRQLVADPESAERLGTILHCDESPSLLMVCEQNVRSLRVVGTRGQPHGVCGLVHEGSTWYLMPMRQPVSPIMYRPEDHEVLETLLGPQTRVLEVPTVSNSATDRFDHPVVQRFHLESSFVARLMGHPAVDHIEHGEVCFERSKAEELVLWLALHPDRQRRSAARSEMWSVPVKDSTFSNITSDVRRTLTTFEIPPNGEQWLGVTMTDDLPLHPRIVTDVSILQQCFEHARRFPEDDGVRVLAHGLTLVRACPLEGSHYLWRDAIGITTEVAVLIVRAAMLCAEMALEDDDLETVFWSTARGLSAVPGHEGLVSVRMRQHARSGDRASLTAEWESYCRTLTSHEWGDAQPSERMIELWFELSGHKRVGS